jgi:hypothetical protein
VTKFFDCGPATFSDQADEVHAYAAALPLLFPMTIAQYLGYPFCETRIVGVVGGLMRRAAIAFDLGSYPSQASPPMMR